MNEKIFMSHISLLGKWAQMLFFSWVVFLPFLCLFYCQSPSRV